MGSRRRAALLEVNTNLSADRQTSHIDLNGSTKTEKGKMSKSNTTKKADREKKVLKDALHKQEEENEALKAQIALLSEELSKAKLEVETKPATAPASNPFGGEFPPNYVAKSAGPPPARPPTAFKFFAAEFRENAKERMPKATPAEINAELKDSWTGLSGEETKPYEKRASEALAQYEREKAVYEEKREQADRTNRAMKAMQEEMKKEAALKFYDDELAKRNAKKPAAVSTSGVLDLDKPKQPRSAWNFYVMQRRAELKSSGAPQPALKELNTIMSESWNKLQKSKKKADKELMRSINNQAAADRERYDSEMAAYNAKVAEKRRKADEEFEEMERIALKQYAIKETAEEMTRQGMKVHAEKIKAEKEQRRTAREQKKAANEAKALLPKAPRSAYNFFVKENRGKVLEECEGLKNTEVMAELGARWKALSDVEKAPYVEFAAADRVRHANESKAISATSQD